MHLHTYTHNSVFFAHKVLSVEVDPKKVETIKIANLIAEGADAFLKAEYAALSAFVVVVAALVAGIVRWEAG
jgi:Na+/H+-translocating membrane pyrophosphatase